MPDDARFARSCLYFVVQGTIDASLLQPSQFFAERDRSVRFLSQYYQDRDLDPDEVLPSVKSSFESTANWLWNTVARGNSLILDTPMLYKRLRFVLQCLKMPSSLPRLMAGYSEFIPQQGNESFDIRLQLEAFYNTCDENGHLQSRFQVSGLDTEINKRTKQVALISTILDGFTRDLHRMTTAGAWAGYEEKGGEFIRLLKFLRSEITGNSSQEEIDHFEDRKQSLLGGIEARREAARLQRANEEEQIPYFEVAKEMDISRQEYDTFFLVSDLICLVLFSASSCSKNINLLHKTEHLSDLHDKSQAIKESLKATDTYQIILAAQRSEGCIIDLQQLQELKDEVFGEFGYTWPMVSTLSDDEFAALGSSDDRRAFLGSVWSKIIWRVRNNCYIPWCNREASHHPLAAARFGYHEDHDDALMEIYGKKIANPSAMCKDIEEMTDEIFDKTYESCTHHHDQRTSAEYHRPVSALQNEFIYPTSPEDSHVSGRELVMTFEIVVFSLKLLAMGTYHSFHEGDETPITSQQLAVEVYNDTDLSSHDVKVWSDERLDECTDVNERGNMMNDAVMGVLSKRSKKCANSDCNEDFANESPDGGSGNHWDHEGGKEREPAELRRCSIMNLLNEIGRYCALTCASCHGLRTWLQRRFPNSGRLYREP